MEVRMNDLRSRATNFLKRAARIISEPARSLDALIRRYVDGERLEDPESQNQLSLCLRAARTQVAGLQDATTGPGRDALHFYGEAVAILQDIQFESSNGRA
jgi:hypothetical protein